jgi:hypothetical protein
MGNIFGKLKNMLGTTKIQQQHPPPKKSDPKVHAASTHWPQEILLLTFVLSHFWPRLMAVA